MTPVDAQAPERGKAVREDRAHPQDAHVAFVRDSVAGSIWTGVSRVSGFAQSLAVAAVLGATYLGNVYQGTNAIPNLIYFQILAGSLFASLVVPPLVNRFDDGDTEGAEHLARSFLGLVLLVSCMLALLLVAASPFLLRIFAADVGDRSDARAQIEVGLVLVALFAPQIACYVVAGTSGAVLNARGHFALAAGAPTIENAGMIVTLITVGVVFGAGRDVTEVSRAEVLVLGIGTTASVALHAAATWIGARRSGVTLIPECRWRDPAVRELVARIAPTLGYTALGALQLLTALVVANALAGGLVAFQLAFNVTMLPIAIVVWPIARSLLPHLTRACREGQDGARELTRAIRLAWFVAIPTATATVVLAPVIATVVAVGDLGRDGGTAMVSWSLLGLGLGIPAEAVFVLGTYAALARHDTSHAVRSMAARVGVAIVMMMIAGLVDGPMRLLILGSAFTLGSVAGAVVAIAGPRSGMRFDRPGLTGPAGRNLMASAWMIVPTATVAYAATWIFGSGVAMLCGLVIASGIGLATYLRIQRAWHAPELEWLIDALAARRARGGSTAREASAG